MVLSVFHPLHEISVRLNVNVRSLCAMIAEFTLLVFSGLCRSTGTIGPWRKTSRREGSWGSLDGFFEANERIK